MVTLLLSDKYMVPTPVNMPFINPTIKRATINDT